jgi:hypothetical protein
MTWASRAMALMTSCQMKKEGSLLLIGLKEHLRRTMQACMIQMLIFCILSQLMNDRYNALRRIFPELIIERHQVSFHPKVKQEHFLLSINISTLLNHFSEEKRTLPLWRKEFCWELFLEGDNGFVEKKIPYNQ